MTADQIPQFVAELTALGIVVCALGDFGYCLDDSDLSEQERDAIAPEFTRIVDAYGDRRHLKPAFIAYLNSIGRYVDADGNDAWRDSN
jgi:hypothetical protein